ncbi:MAG: hypothetical protein SGILL_001174 [Bacillariaceae sp.]
MTEEGSSSSSHKKTALETPRVLTRNLIPSLTYGLDASDMLECYTLVRSAPLHGIANSTISIQKSVLGIRFRPKQDVAALNVKKPMELTLEYGPLRVGQDLNDEAMPIVQLEEATSYLSWDNVGKVYFTRKLVKENYLSSYYMASMTGAVLDELLLEAVKYAERRKIYQPFAVYSEEKGRELRSSSSSDFTWFIWTHLARLGVEVDPILPPPIYEARLWVDSVTKVVPESDTAHRAAVFYQKLYSCLEAIATKNYANYQDDTDGPTSSPSLGLPPNDSDKDSNNESGDGDGDRYSRRLEDQQATNSASTSDESDSDKEETNQRQQPHDENKGDGADPAVIPTDPPTESPIEDASSSPTAKASPAPSEYFSEEPTTPMEEEDEDAPDEDDKTPAEPAKDAEKANQAADEAQKAADEAKNAAQTEGETKAADAAQAAADAAHAAAAATSKAASQSAMDSLLSGDGSLMSSIVTTCFTDPRYEIASADENGTITAEAFLYRDSAFYYELELVSPYVVVTKVNRQMPRTIYNTGLGSGGDSLDWFLALSIASAVLLLVLLICQQMGKNYVSSLARCQRWFFNPRKYDYEGNTVSGVQSGSMFFFGESGIPPSMGGRRSSYSPLQRRTTTDIVDQRLSIPLDDEDFQTPSLHYQGNDEQAQLEIEMKSLTPPKFHTPPPARSASGLPRSQSSQSLESTEEDADMALENSLPVPDRFFRDPSEVEMPSLKSKSRVAVPVGSNNSVGSGTRSRTSSLNELGHEDSFEL